MKLFSERKMEFCAVFSEFLPKQKNISVSLSKAGCPKGEDFGSVKCCKYTETFGEYDKKKLFSKIASIKYKIQQSFVDDK